MNKLRSSGLLIALMAGVIPMQADSRIPHSIALRVDQQASFHVRSVSDSKVAYDWFWNGVRVTSDPDDIFTVSGHSLGQTPDRLEVRARNSAGIQAGEVFTVYRYEKPFATASMSGLSSLSVRAECVPSGQPLTLGFSISGSDELPVFVRAAGRELLRYGLRQVVDHPSLSVYENGSLALFNDDWTSNGLVQFNSELAEKVGAFPFLETYGKDSAMCFIARNQRTIQVRPSSGSLSSGVVLLEAYSCANSSTARFVNGSILHHVGIGDATLILGFAISGSNTPTKLLIRGIGPGLSGFGITNYLTAPRLELHGTRDGQDVVLMANQGWDGSIATQNSFSSVGAFPLSPKSSDAAVIVSLVSGTYSVLLSGVNGATGTGLIEVYELP